jgi:hypothetical protein
VKTATNKRLLIFESHGDSNRYTPCRGKPNQYVTTLPTPAHVCPTYAFCGQSPYVVTFHESSIELSRPTAPEKKGSRHNPQRAADRYMGPYPASLPSQPMKQWGQNQASINSRLLGLVGPYHQYLTNTGGGYNLEGADFPRTTPRPAISPFP